MCRLPRPDINPDNGDSSPRLNAPGTFARHRSSRALSLVFGVTGKILVSPVPCQCDGDVLACSLGYEVGGQERGVGEGFVKKGGHLYQAIFYGVTYCVSMVISREPL